jgi:hypothetical protein
MTAGFLGAHGHYVLEFFALEKYFALSVVSDPRLPETI